jgi:hypothetical protein
MKGPGKEAGQERGVKAKEGAICVLENTGCPNSELDKENTPSPNPLFFQKITDSACIEP